MKLYCIPTTRGVWCLEHPGRPTWAARRKILLDSPGAGKVTLHETEAEARAPAGSWLPVEVLQITEAMIHA